MAASAVRLSTFEMCSALASLGRSALTQTRAPAEMLEE